MISELQPHGIILTNLVFMISWNMIIFYASITLDSSFFKPNKTLYSIKRWERNGKFYTEELNIKKWKDSLPQHIGRDGFSKKHLKRKSNISEDYLEKFIIETCRAEWNHIMCCFFPIIAFIINSFFYAVAFSFLSILTNLPFIFIQRYNRIRLEKLLTKCISKQPNYQYEKATE